MAPDPDERRFDRKIAEFGIRIKDADQWKVQDDVFDEVTLLALYRLVHKGRLIPAWEFRDAGGQPVLHVEAVRDHSKLVGGLATVPKAANSNPDMALLLVVAWYFVVMEWAEEEAEAATDSTIVAWSG